MRNPDLINIIHRLAFEYHRFCFWIRLHNLIVQDIRHMSVAG